MEKYILNLLKENSRVIIPEFGAFIIRQQNPPEIAFNSFLTFNDGILTEYIRHNSGISFLEAQAKVSEYAEKLNADLKLHNRLSFNEIGWVWLDESGEKQFTPWKSADHVQTETQKPLRDIGTILKEADLPGIQPDQVPFVLDDTIKEVEIDATRDDLLNKPADDSFTEEDLSGESFSLEESAISEPEIRNEAEPIIIGIRFKHEMPLEETVIAPMTEVTQDTDSKEASTEILTAGSVYAEPEKPHEEVWHEIETKSTHLQEPPQEVKKRSWIFPVTIIGALIIIAGAGWLLFPEQVTKIINPKKQLQVEIQPGVEIGDNTETSPSITDNQSEQESAEEATPALNESETAEQKETPVVSDQSDLMVKKYYVVAGRFRSQQNAEKYTAELRSKGFNAEYFATNDNLYTVSFSSFSSRASAEIEMNRIRTSIEPKAWILLY